MRKKVIEILKLVQNMQIETGKKKLVKQDVAERLGMTRQGLAKYNDEVYPYIEGKYDVSLILKQLTGNDDNPFDLLLKKHEEMLTELDTLKKNFNNELENQRERLVTSLMKDDVLAHLSNNLRKDKEKALLHNDELQQQITKLELELGNADSDDNRKIKEKTDKNIKQVLVKFDLSPVFANYKANKDREAFEDDKEIALERLVKKVKRQLIVNKVPLVLFVDRYLCRLDKFVNSKLPNFGDAVIVQMPLFDRYGIRTFVDSIGCVNPIHICIPVCLSESIKNAQRKFFSSSVPDVELEQADNEYIPAVNEGFATTLTFTVSQGD
jgi:hypothetical protein